MTRYALSSDVRTKARALAVAVVDRGPNAAGDHAYSVGEYRVVAVADGAKPTDWHCSCRWARFGGVGCAHVRAAYAFAYTARMRAAAVAAADAAGLEVAGAAAPADAATGAAA